MQKDTISDQLNNLRDPESLKIKDFLDRSSILNSSILLYGETGAGKDFWAKYIFFKSQKENFVNINCGDTPEHLLESEWFGYKKGAFTGATGDFEGKWSSAKNGILFLNQIDLLSLGMQAKLLRILENRSYFSLGSIEEKKIEAKLIFSADWDINEKVGQGLFRKDLFYRISSLSVLIPPLRKRKEDILSLLNYFAVKKNVTVKLTPKGNKRVLAYPWLGNIREIENFVNNISIRKKVLEDRDTGLLSGSKIFIPSEVYSEELSMDDLERRYIEHLLEKYGNRSKVARILKISRKSLYNKMKKYGKS